MFKLHIIRDFQSVGLHQLDGTIFLSGEIIIKTTIGNKLFNNANFTGNGEPLSKLWVSPIGKEKGSNEKYNFREKIKQTEKCKQIGIGGGGSVYHTEGELVVYKRIFKHPTHDVFLDELVHHTIIDIIDILNPTFNIKPFKTKFDTGNQIMQVDKFDYGLNILLQTIFGKIARIATANTFVKTKPYLGKAELTYKINQISTNLDVIQETSTNIIKFFEEIKQLEDGLRDFVISLDIINDYGITIDDLKSPNIGCNIDAAGKYIIRISDYSLGIVSIKSPFIIFNNDILDMFTTPTVNDNTYRNVPVYDLSKFDNSAYDGLLFKGVDNPKYNGRYNDIGIVDLFDMLITIIPIRKIDPLYKDYLTKVFNAYKEIFKDFTQMSTDFVKTNLQDTEYDLLKQNIMRAVNAVGPVGPGISAEDIHIGV